MADADDVRRVAGALPRVVEIPSAGFDFRVAGKGFVWSYPERQPGRPRVIRTDVAVLFVGDEDEKQALLLGEPALFFRAPGYGDAPLVLLRLTEVSVERLTELVTDAWRMRAPDEVLEELDNAGMSTGDRTAAQLRAISWLHAVLSERGIDYWLFGGWAVDFHVGRVTRDHEDVDVAVWESNLDQLRTMLDAHDWVHVPEPGDDGYTTYQRDDVRIEFAFLDRDNTGAVYTPLVEGRGEWPEASFGDVVAHIHEVHARVVGLSSLIKEKSVIRDDPTVASKDRADVAVLECVVTDDVATRLDS